MKIQTLSKQLASIVACIQRASSNCDALDASTIEMIRHLMMAQIVCFEELASEIEPPLV